MSVQKAMLSILFGYGVKITPDINPIYALMNNLVLMTPKTYQS